MTEPWMHLSRWRATTQGNGWKVAAEGGRLAPDPCFFAEHKDAQRRADELNSEETAKMRAKL